MLGAGAGLLLALPAWAEARQALVIAGRSAAQEVGQPGRDALAVSRALLAAGFDVRRLENPASLPEPPAEAPDVMLVYVSADLADSGGQAAVALPSGPVPLAELAARYPAAQRIVLAEACAVAPLENPAAEAVEVPEAPAKAMIAHSPADCTSAARLTAVLLAALEQPGSELGASLSDGGLPVATGTGWTGFTALAARPNIARPNIARPNAEDPETLILDKPLRPVSGLASTTRPASPDAAGQAAPSGVQIFNAAAPVRPLDGNRAARPTAAGLPEPSIIVGERPRADGVTPPIDSLAGSALGTGVEERRRIRAEDPRAFASLLDSGAFDPPADQMASAIQTELQRMNCYTGRIDGDWGNGSRRAVDRYFQQAGGSAVTREADVALFRQIALRDDLRCPDVVQPVVRDVPEASTRQPAAARANPTRSAVTRQPAQTRQAAPQPAAPPAAPAQPRINPNALGSGIFR